MSLISMRGQSITTTLFTHTVFIEEKQLLASNLVCLKWRKERISAWGCGEGTNLTSSFVTDKSHRTLRHSVEQINNQATKYWLLIWK